MTDLLTQSQLKEIISYNEKTGLFTWEKPSGNRVKIGDVAGCIRKCYGDLKYNSININNVRHKAHRLAWLYVYGCFPKHEIDHINGDGCDNRINNLRDIPHIDNLKNQKLSKNNSSGHNGVRWNKLNNNWRVILMVNGRNINIGSYLDISDAVIARNKAYSKYGFHKNHGVERLL